jgi:hypothetical protein
MVGDRVIHGSGPMVVDFGTERNGPPKMPVVNQPTPARLEESNLVDEVDEEEFTEVALKDEVARRDAAQKA